MIKVETFEPTPVDRKEMLRYAACGVVDKAVMKLCEECIEESNPLFHYRVCSTLLPVDLQGEFLQIGEYKTSSQTLKTALRGCRQALLFAATVGIEFDRLIARYSQTSPAKALLLQALGAERIESLCNTFVQAYQKEIAPSGGLLKPRVSPGYGDFPLSMQKEFFAWLDCPRKIGLTLNESFMMSPSKSVTAIAGIAKKTAERSKE